MWGINMAGVYALDKVSHAFKPIKFNGTALKSFASVPKSYAKRITYTHTHPSSRQIVDDVVSIVISCFY